MQLLYIFTQTKSCVTSYIGARFMVFAGSGAVSGGRGGTGLRINTAAHNYQHVNASITLRNYVNWRLLENKK